MKTTLIVLAVIVGLLGLTWLGVTVFAQKKSPEKISEFLKQGKAGNALLIYHHDPFTSFNQKILSAFSETLNVADWQTTIATTSAASKLDISKFNMVIISSNTYNWMPDWETQRLIKEIPGLQGKSIIAITLGGGNTQHSQKSLEALIQSRGGILIASRSLWTSRPNDELRLEENNEDVAVNLTRSWAMELSKNLKLRSLNQ